MENINPTNEYVRNARYRVFIPSEKMTDVNIAVEMISDAHEDKFDVALLISADSDLCAPIKAIQQLFPEKSVVVAFPPNRKSYELQNLVNNRSIDIYRHAIKRSQLPATIVKDDGFELKRPLEWR